MHVVVIAAGSYGDVAPYTGLGSRLRDAGHDVTVAAHPPFADLVTGAGLGFHPLPGDLVSLLSVPSSDRPPSPMFLNGRVPQLSQYLLEVADGIVDATEAADVVLVGGAAPFGYHAAVARGLPSMGVFLQPFEPSGDYPSPMTNSGRSLGRSGNRLIGRALLAGLYPYHRAGARIRARLGAPPERANATRSHQAASGWPVFHGYSTVVLPRPREWRPDLTVTGYWWPAEPAEWTPPPELSRFLDAGPPPVLLSFGSMARGAGPWLAEAVLGAVRRAGVRAVVQAGWAELDVTTDDVLTIGPAPHSWLMPRAAAVVHHGGAGTTAAGLRAGVPAVTTPIYADQPLWGRRLTELGVGPPPVPFRRLTAERLGDALRQAVSRPDHAARAGDLARLLATEDGAAPVVAAVDRLAH